MHDGFTGEINVNPAFFTRRSLRAAGIKSTLSFGAPGAPVFIDGQLKIESDSASDSITLRNTTVNGNTSIKTGGSRDTLTIDDCTFTGTFTADLGIGDDTIAIGQAVGSAAPVTFAGKATILGGIGNDLLQLGKSLGSGGDANSKGVFQAAGNKIDGGNGVDTFDDELGQFEGVALGTDIMNWTDPTP